jgi:flagellar assembly factor FliW
MAEFGEDAVLSFPEGLPGFVAETQFVLLQRQSEYPLVYLQSTRTADLCFLALPVLSADSRYALELSDEDTVLLQVPPCPVIGTDVLCLALVSLRANQPTANLFAPIVVNLATRVSAQCFQPSTRYSHRHSLLPQQEGVTA